MFGVPYLVWFPIVLVVVFSWILHRTAYGVRVFATGGNTEAAYLAGIAVDRVRTSAYVWCGALAGVAGVMLASRVQSGQPTAGMFYELTAIAAVILGGASLFGGEGKLYKSSPTSIPTGSRSLSDPSSSSPPPPTSSGTADRGVPPHPLEHFVIIRGHILPQRSNFRILSA